MQYYSVCKLSLRLSEKGLFDIGEKTLIFKKQRDRFRSKFGKCLSQGFSTASLSYEPSKWRFRVMPNYTPNNPSAGGIWYVLKSNWGYLALRYIIIIKRIIIIMINRRNWNVLFQHYLFLPRYLNIFAFRICDSALVSPPFLSVILFTSNSNSTIWELTNCSRRRAFVDENVS